MDNGSQPAAGSAGGAATVTGSTKAANRRATMKFFANSGTEAPF